MLYSSSSLDLWQKFPTNLPSPVALKTAAHYNFSSNEDRIPQSPRKPSHFRPFDITPFEMSPSRYEPKLSPPSHHQSMFKFSSNNYCEEQSIKRVKCEYDDKSPSCPTSPELTKLDNSQQVDQLLGTVDLIVKDGLRPAFGERLQLIRDVREQTLNAEMTYNQHNRQNVAVGVRDYMTRTVKNMDATNAMVSLIYSCFLPLWTREI